MPKEIIQHLHAGHPPEQVKARLREIVRQTDASEIMVMEQELMSEGIPVEEVRSMRDLHSHSGDAGANTESGAVAKVAGRTTAVAIRRARRLTA